MSNAPTPATTAAGDASVRHRVPTVRVLLVEDDQIDRMAIERYVLRQGLPFEVETAHSGADALQKLRAAAFDVVLLDYMLGDMTGLELLPELRGVPAIFITGMGNEEIAASALRQGAYDYLVKDPDRAYLQVLPVVIRNVLEHRSAEQSLRGAKDAADEAVRAKEKLAALIAGELRTPLSAAADAIRLLRGELGATLAPRQRELLEALAKSHDSMLRTVDELVELGRASGAPKP